ncbi:ABC transporter substrate-binding protein [Nostoc sp. C117]|uniref:ABC transporter substrate-binding protein n=1 Tax=Nostoc sp. C117 TaxID=3349875 RepID=UPI00370D9D65
MCPNSQSQRSPYIIGTAIRNIDQLFGRENLLRTIADSLQQDAKFILLHGQRRIGKSSVLQNIHHFVSPDEFVFVSCDFQEHGHATLGQILYAIAKEIFEHLNLDQNILNPLLDLSADFRSIRRIVNNRILPPIDEALNNKKLVLLLDEFDVVNQNDTEQAVEFLRFLENLVRQQEYLFVIAVVGRYLNAMPNLVQSFRGAPFYEIGLLDNNDAKRLITQPADKILEYQEKTIAEILKVSSGHPFCTQVLCHEIFQLVRNQNNPTNPTIVVPNYVVEVIPDAIESSGGGLDSIWKGLSISEKVVILAVAEAQNSHTIQNPLKLLESYGLVLTNSLQEAIQLLIDKGFLDSNPVKIKVELVRIWLLQRHPLRDEIRSLEILEEENVNQLLFVARSCWMGDKQQQDAALAIYEQALKLNPNHFSTILELAEKHLQLENFDKALKLYDRVDKLDRIGYQEEFIKALDRYGHWLITQRNYIAAKQQYEKILQIQRENSLAQNKLAEIKAYQNNNNNKANLIQQVLRLPILLISLGLIGGSVSLIFGILLANSCPAGQEKNLGIFCINSLKISSGDRTLFPDIKNSDRDKGIQSFKNRNYKEAEDYFKKAFADKNNRPDPEVLIYQNNARAIQQGNPLTLAAIVPATNITDSALERLRGIAQAQNQFNQGGGLNSRLLEIVIGDDNNNEDTAKRVAEELVKDKSILGVIGHGSSDATIAALPTYTSANLAIISPTSTSTQFPKQVFFRAINSNKVTGKNLAEYAWKQNLKKVIIFCNPKDSYSNTMREEFRINFMANLGAEIVDGGETCIHHNLADPNFNVDREVQDIFRNQNPAQAIVLFPDTQHLEIAGKIAKAHKDLIDTLQRTGSNIQKLKLIGGDVLYNNEFLNQYSDALEGLVLSTPWFPEAPKSKEFAQKAKAQWRGDVNWRTATSFDATQAFIESFKLSPNPSQKTVLKNLPQVKLSSKNTSGEELVFDKNTREMKREEIPIMVKNGKFVVIAEPN